MTHIFHATDTSNNQGAGVVNIGPEIIAAGGNGWWHKATQGTGFKDAYWPAVRANAARLGLRYRGPYHWLSPNGAVSDQLANFRAHVGALAVGESIQLDIEDPAGLSDNLVIQAIDAWESAYPGRVVVYTGRYYGRSSSSANYLVDRLLAHYGPARFRWWLPAYQSVYPRNLPTTPIVWQWAGGANGIALSVGQVDSNQYIDPVRLDAVSGYGIHPAPAPPPVPVPGGTDVSLALIIVDDAYARFAGDMNTQGVVNTVRWIGPRLNSVIGFQPDNVTPRLAGTTVLHRTVSSMTDFTLDGPPPKADKVTWTEANFYQGD